LTRATEKGYTHTMSTALELHNRRQIEAALPRFRLILAWRKEGLTFQDIGDGLGVSRERAQQLYRKALRRCHDTTS